LGGSWSHVIVGLYLVISFRKWQYSLGAIAAVAHDVIFVLGIYSLLWKYMPFGMEIDQHFIAAILTVIGYSMNDTVIVFDRVREYLVERQKETSIKL
jgi:SecD/SecF fusion protein